MSSLAELSRALIDWQEYNRSITGQRPYALYSRKKPRTSTANPRSLFWRKLLSDKGSHLSIQRYFSSSTVLNRWIIAAKGSSTVCYFIFNINQLSIYFLEHLYPLAMHWMAENSCPTSKTTLIKLVFRLKFVMNSFKGRLD